MSSAESETGRTTGRTTGRGPRGADRLPTLTAGALEVREARPDPGPGPARDALVERGEAAIIRAEAELVAAAARWLDRLHGQATARLKGPRARRDTRWWSQQEGKARQPVLEVKALDGDYIVPQATVREIVDIAHPAARRIVEASVEGTAQRVGRSAAGAGFGLSVFDEQRLESALDDVLARMLDVGEHHAQMLRRAILDADDDADTLDDVLDHVAQAQRAGTRHVENAARNIGGALHNDTSMAAGNALGCTHAQWLSRRDERVRATHRLADGQVRAIGDGFSVGAHELLFPRDPSGLPITGEEVYGCRCCLLMLPPDDDRVAAARTAHQGNPRGTLEELFGGEATTAGAGGAPAPVTLSTPAVGYRHVEGLADVGLRAGQVIAATGVPQLAAVPGQVAAGAVQLAVLIPAGTPLRIVDGVIEVVGAVGYELLTVAAGEVTAQVVMG